MGHKNVAGSVGRVLSPPTAMTLNDLKPKLEDLRGRVDALRRYL